MFKLLPFQRRLVGSFRVPLPILTLFPVLLCTLVLNACGGKKSQGPGEPGVEVVRVLQRTVPEIVEYVGQTEAPTNVEIRARVEGFIEKVAFQEGSEVKEGDLLFVIDPKPYQEQLDNAKAKLAEAKANQLKTQQDVDRFAPLAKMQAIPRRDFDTAAALNEQAKAAVQAAESEVTTAELNLGYTRMMAPLNGRVGASLVRVGSLVGKGEATLLTTLSSTDKIWVSFNVTEARYLRFTREGRKPEDIKFQLVLADGSLFPYPGKINFAERAFDPTTGTLKVRVEFPNPGGILRPGLYGKVRVNARDIPDALLIPQRAVQEIQDLKTVLVVGPDDKVSTKNIKLGSQIGSFAVITEGLQAGDRVIVEGIQKVREGMKVQAKEIPVDTSSLGPETSAASQPSASQPSSH